MKRTHFLSSVIVIVAILLTAGLTSVMAATTVPSWEILSIDADNDCQNGIVWIYSHVNHNGTGSVHGWIGREGVGNEASYGLVDFSLIPSGPYVSQINIPGSFPDNTIFYIDFTTYAQANNGGNATFRSKISFNCTTGEQVGPVENTSYINLQRIDVPNAGPAFEHPGDIVTLRPELLLQPQLQLQGQHLRGQFGG